MIAFFNDFDMATEGPWVAAVQLLGAKGFFRGYDARLGEALGSEEEERWRVRARELGLGEETIAKVAAEATIGDVALALYRALV